LDVDTVTPPAEESEPFPQVHKPDLLVSFLASSLLNFDIFTWHLGIGEWLESVADWILERINDLIVFVVTIYRKVEAAWDKALEVGASLLPLIGEAISPITRWIQGVPDLVTNAIKAFIPTVKNIISALISPFVNLVESAFTLAKEGVAGWNDFQEKYFPNLFTKKETSDLVHSETDPLKAEVATQKSFLETLREFVDDPEKWLLDKICNMLARFI
jgi:hypothetical protein